MREYKDHFPYKMFPRIFVCRLKNHTAELHLWLGLNFMVLNPITWFWWYIQKLNPSQFLQSIISLTTWKIWEFKKLDDVLNFCFFLQLNRARQRHWSMTRLNVKNIQNVQTFVPGYDYSSNHITLFINKVFFGSCIANDKKFHDRFKRRCSKKNKAYLK